MSRPKLIIFVYAAICLTSSLSNRASANCAPFERIQLESLNFFRGIHGEKDEDLEDVWTSKFRLPGSRDCQIEETHSSDLFSGSYQCTWYLTKDINAELQARNAYEELIADILPCVSKPESISRRKTTGRPGERASIDDPYPNMPKAHLRSVTVGYKYFSNRWMIQLDYDIFENK